MKIRIIGGDKRRLQLEVPDNEQLRPTPDRMRETLFNWLGQDLTGWEVLDLFAGSGILGFEAASRGAKQVVMIEWVSSLYQHLCHYREKFGFSAQQIILFKQDAWQYLRHTDAKFDLIFCDPPYHTTDYPQLITALLKRVRPHAFLYVEAPHSLLPTMQPLLPENFILKKQQKMGQVVAHLWQNCSHDNDQ